MIPGSGFGHPRQGGTAHQGRGRRSKRFHAGAPQALGLFGGFDRWRRTAGGSLVDDDLTQILDAVFGEGGYAILTHTVDPEAVVFDSRNMSIDSSCSQSSSSRSRFATQPIVRWMDRRHDQAAWCRARLPVRRQ
jgi:hypothetical protein